MTTVDILLATYNGESFIREQIDSLLNQTYPDIRVIIRDDGSKDSTRLILEEYAQRRPDKIRLLFDGENLGAQQNFARLMEFARSDYIMFCDQDDVWKNDKVEKSLKEMRRLEAEFGKTVPLLVHTDLCVADKHLNEKSPSFWKYVKLNPKNDGLNRLIVQNVVTGCTVLMNRALLELSTPIPKEALMHDWWVALAASAFGKIGFVPEATIYYRQHGKNQIGAIKYSLYTLLKKGFQRFIVNFWDRRIKFSIQKNQVEAFYRQYEERLDKKQKEMLKAYLGLPFCFYMAGRYRVIKYGFFRSGFARNIGVFLIAKQP